MRISVTGVLVDDLAKTLAFNMDVPGLVLQHDVPIGDYRWLIVVASEGHDDVGLLLEPNTFRLRRCSGMRSSIRAFP